jgi:hypothetical protein
MTFSSAVSPVSNWKDWNTKPTRRARSRARPSSSRPPRSTPASHTRPLARHIQARQQAQQGRFAGTGRADHRHAFALADGEVDVIKDEQRTFRADDLLAQPLDPHDTAPRSVVHRGAAVTLMPLAASRSWSTRIARFSDDENESLKMATDAGCWG